MDSLYEVIGRKQCVIDAQDDAYTQLIQLLDGVVTGKIDVKRVTVNLKDRTWALAPDTDPLP